MQDRCRATDRQGRTSDGAGRRASATAPIDLTRPFEDLARIPDSTYTTYAPTDGPVRDHCGLRILPDTAWDRAPVLDVLHVPGGPGQEALMDDEELLGWLRTQAGGARHVLSVCTGALLLGAAGLLVGRRATTHWAALDLLPSFGAHAVPDRVVVDGGWTFAGGVTAGIDGALALAAQLRGREVAEGIQLAMQYAPEPPFTSGVPQTAPEAVRSRALEQGRDLAERRRRTAARFAARLGVTPAGNRTPRYEQA